MTPPRHLLTVWNPGYASDALDAHLEVLLGWAELASRGEADPEEIYVWWAKLRSTNREQPELPHAAEISGLQHQILSAVETHLYLTDYRSVYVALLDEITADDVLVDTPAEADHMPHYYHGRQADFWFCITDVRQLVADDTPAVIAELQKLRNTRYHDRPVSLYGGMVDLPLIVTRESEVSWFSDRGTLTGGRLWAEHDAELRGETGRMSAELRDNLLGRDLWARLEPTTRAFLASAEAGFRQRRSDPRFDFSGVALGYAKAVETELNALLFPALNRVLKDVAYTQREARDEGRAIDLGRPVPHQTLGALRRLLEHDGTVRRYVPVALGPAAGWLTQQLPAQLGRIEELRNPGAHSETVARGEAERLREMVLGIGCYGLIVRLGEVGRRGV